MKDLKPEYKTWAEKHGTPWQVSFPTRGAIAGRRRFFATEQLALSAIAEWKDGTVSAGFGKRVADEVLYCQSLLPEGVTLTAAVRYFIEHHTGLNSTTVASVAKGYLDDLRKQAKSEHYQAEQARMVEVFTKAFGAETLFSTLNKAKLVAFIKEPETYWPRYARKRIVSCLVSKARELEAIRGNPLDGVSFEDAPKKRIHFLKQADVEAILDYTLRKSPAALPALALKCFMGIRTEELSRAVTPLKRPLLWEDIKMGKLIDLPESVTKTNTRRVIDFWPAALTHWLNACGTLPATGKVCPVDGLDNLISKLVKALNRERVAAKLAPVDYQQNDFRRTFASHSVALNGTDKTRDYLGQRDNDVLFTNYRGFVDETEAKAYFESSPVGLPSNVIALSA